MSPVSSNSSGVSSGSTPLNKLSAGAKAGLGVGIGVGVSVLLSLAYFACLRRKRTDKSGGSAGEKNKPVQTDLYVPELDFHPARNSGQQIYHEMPENSHINATPPQEMSTHKQ